MRRGRPAFEWRRTVAPRPARWAGEAVLALLLLAVLAFMFHPAVPPPLTGEQAWTTRSASVLNALATDVAMARPEPASLERALSAARSLPPPPEAGAARRWAEALGLVQRAVVEMGLSPAQARSDLGGAALDLTTLGAAP